jgi:hypothetical protein
MRLPLLAVATTLLFAGCSGGGEPATHVPGQPMTFPVYSDAVIDELGERMIAKCSEDADPNDPGCVARVKARNTSCRADMPEVFQTREEYREHAKTFLFCVDRL